MEHVLICECMKDLQCGVHNQVGKGEPDLRVGGDVRVVGRAEATKSVWRMCVERSVSVDCMYECPEACVIRNGEE